jgi:hypothetical protein
MVRNKALVARVALHVHHGAEFLRSGLPVEILLHVLPEAPHKLLDDNSESIPVTEQRLVSSGKPLSDCAQELAQLSLCDGSYVDVNCRLLGGAEIPLENLSNKGGRLEWLEMTGPGGEQAVYSMSRKDVKASGTITYECSQKKANKNPRPDCTAYAVHKAGAAAITIKRAAHNHPPPNREVS